MMGILAGLLGAFSGPLTRYLVLAVGGVLAITGAHLVLEQWKGNLRAEGERRCDARWESQIREEASAAARRDANSARQLLESERRTTEELHDRVTAMQDELERVRAASSGGDERCLSDGVLKQLGKSGQRPERDARPAEQPKAAPSGPAEFLQKLFSGADG